ncbi:MAG: HEAT repeat domain-containing protein [Candidatus Heimdallarchaeota archaeon]|nr:HEAT repeat domain-containing protein [Candidatus Heimdallarchaeota archaeon]
MVEENWQEKVKGLIEQITNEDIETRQDAAWTLHKSAEKGIKEVAEAIPALITAMHDDDWVVRKMSILALGVLKVEKVIPSIIDVLKNDSNNEVRVGAAEALGDMQAEQAVPELINALDASYEMLCYVAIYSLSKIGEKAVAAVPKLLELLAIPEEVGIIQTNILTAMALGEIGDASAIEPLKVALNSAATHECQFTIAYSLALLEGAEGTGMTELKRMKDNYEFIHDDATLFEKLLEKLN